MDNIKQALDLIVAEREQLLRDEETNGKNPKKERKLRKVIDILKSLNWR